MVAVFVPQFFLLIGIDFFLVAAIATTILDRYFPSAVTYMMVIGGFFGFSQLVIGPEYLSAFSDDMQFYYCAGFALISLLSLIGLNLYLFLLDKKKVVVEEPKRTKIPCPACGKPVGFFLTECPNCQIELEPEEVEDVVKEDPAAKEQYGKVTNTMLASCVWSMTVTIPASLILLFFENAYVNYIPVALPAMPVVPMSIIYIEFVVSVILLSIMIINTSQRWSGWLTRPKG